MKLIILKKKLLAVILVFLMGIIYIPLSASVSALSVQQTDIYVGYPLKSNNYSNITSAVAACTAKNPRSEEQRVTVHIKPGTYREQVLINTPYISFVNEEPSNGTVLLTWYYGIGYKYYSVGSNGYYSASAAASKIAKTEPTSRWGCSVYLQSNATAFRAENITFEASFNRYVTNEEIADGVEVSGSQSITFDRKAYNADVTSKAATERAAAIAIDANHTEFYNCSFLGSQDTLYTGSVTGFFKKCLIQGNTDYIFGSGDFVYDNCELRFYGYSNTAVGGYITAAREQILGYLFWQCSVTANSSLNVATGYFGRPWRATAAVTFYNTVLQYSSLINSAGWTSMSGVTPDQANYNEYNTKLADSSSANTSGRINGTVLSQSEASSITRERFLGGWIPYYFNYSGSSNPDNVSTFVLDADDVQTGTYSSDVIVNQHFSIKVNAENAVTVDNSGSKVSSDGLLSITNRIKLGGAGNTANRSIMINASGKGSLKVYMMSSNSAESRTVNLLDSTGTVVSSVNGVNGTSLDAYSFNIPSAGFYYLTSAGSGINIYYAVLTVSSQTDIDLLKIKKYVHALSEDSADCDLNQDGTVNAFDILIAKRGLLK